MARLNEMANRIRELAEAGFIRSEIARQLGVDYKSLRLWLRKHPEIAIHPKPASSRPREAIELMRSRGITVMEAARETGTSESSIWVMLASNPELREGLAIRPRVSSGVIEKMAHEAIRLMGGGETLFGAAKRSGLKVDSLRRFLGTHPDLIPEEVVVPPPRTRILVPMDKQKLKAALAFMREGQTCKAAASAADIPYGVLSGYLFRNPEAREGIHSKPGRPLLPQPRMHEAIERIRGGASWAEAARESGLQRHQIAYYLKTHPQTEGLPENVRVRMAITGMQGGANAQLAAQQVGVAVNTIWRHLVRNPQVLRRLVIDSARGLQRATGPVPRLAQSELAGAKAKVLEVLAMSSEGLRLAEVMEAVGYPLSADWPRAEAKANSDHFRRQVMAPLVEAGALVIVGTRRAARYRKAG